MHILLLFSLALATSAAPFPGPQAPPAPAPPVLLPPPPPPPPTTVGVKICDEYSLQGECKDYVSETPGTCIALAKDDRENFVSAQSLAPDGYCAAYKEVEHFGNNEWGCADLVTDVIDHEGYKQLFSFWGNWTPFDWYTVEDIWSRLDEFFTLSASAHPHIQGFECYDHHP